MSVYRIYVEKKPAFAQEAAARLSDIRTLLQITSLEELRLLNRYDVEGIDEALFDSCRSTVFSEPQLDNTYSQDVYKRQAIRTTLWAIPWSTSITSWPCTTPPRKSWI